MRRLLRKVVALVVPLLVLLLIKHGKPDLPHADERAAFDLFDPEIGWVGRPNHHGNYKGAVTFDVRQNNIGMRGPDLGVKRRPRVLVLGDSYVWGYDAQQDVMFTEVLGRRFPNAEIVNAGVSGYGTDQEYLWLQRYFERVKPDAVVVVFSNTDNSDNASRVMVGYNKPWFTDENGTLVLHGVPVAKSLNFWALDHPELFRHAYLAWTISAIAEAIRPYPIVGPTMTVPIVREMQRYLAARGVGLGFLFETPDPPLQGFLTAHDVPWVGTSNVEYGDSHWTAKGHIQVADLLEPLVRQLVPALAQPAGAATATTPPSGPTPR